MSHYLLDHTFPDDLKTMDYEELELLSYELRDFLVESVSKTGGHLAPNLGIVEITIALHKCFDTPKDKLIWDVGHQSYVHKILTGRMEQFDTLRKHGGLSGFPKTAESEYDCFDTGHSSNSISIGLGMATARDLKNEDYNVVSIIGDGALSGGLAFEALNNAGSSKTNMIVLLNDNGMSISKNTGGLSSSLGRITSTDKYIHTKTQIKKGLPVLHDGKIIVRRHPKGPQALGQHLPMLPRDADHRLKLLRPPLQLQHQGAHFDGLRLRSEDQHHFFHSFSILRPRAGDRPDLCLDGNISLRTMQSFSVCIVIASVI